jgi:serine protease Do
VAARGQSFAKQLSQAFHSAAEKVSPSVVTITTTPKIEKRVTPRGGAAIDPGDEGDGADPLQGSPFGDMFRQNPELRRFFRDMPSTPERQVREMGSGVIIDPSGIILTNNHVVEDGASGGKVVVRLSDGREFTAKEVKTDPKTDLAIVRIEGAGTLPATKLGDSDVLDVGDWVLALGQPFGLEGTVTAGIISAKGRSIGSTPRENFLQTDAAINPGNSGGPLVNLDGEIVGINTAISTQSGGYQGVGFAIPSNLAKWVTRQLIEKGKVQRAYLGIVIQPVTPDLAERFGVKIHEGILVSQVPPGTPAAKAGLKEGDIILQYGGKKVSTPQELQGVVEESKIGSSQPALVLRDGKRMTVDVAPGEQPADYGMARIRGGQGPATRPESSSFDKLGIQAETLTPELGQRLGVKSSAGVVITQVQPGSPAQAAGLATGMVITQANRKPVKTVDDLRKIVEQQPLEKGLLLLVQSGQGSRFIVIRAQD